MKKVAILLNNLTAGGAERVVSRLSYPLAEKYDLYIILLEHAQQFYDCAGTIIYLSDEMNAQTVWHKIYHLGKLVKKYNFDVVFSFLRVPNLINIICKKNAKTVISVRCYIDKAADVGISKKCKHIAEKYLYRCADNVIAVSKLIARQMQDEYYVEKNKICIIENPYNIEKIRKECMEGIEKETEEFISRHQTVVTMGRLTAVKGCRHLLEIIARIRRAVPEIGLLVLGEGEDEIYLKKRAEELEIGDNVLFLGNKKNPFAYIKRCCLFVSASSLEGFPNALIEAMCCGVPVIFSDCRSGPREILSEKEQSNPDEVEYAEYGILAPDFARVKSGSNEYNKKVDAYANAIVNVLSSPNLLSHYAAMAQERAELYSEERCIRKYCAIIEA